MHCRGQRHWQLRAARCGGSKGSWASTVVGQSGCRRVRRSCSVETASRRRWSCIRVSGVQRPNRSRHIDDALAWADTANQPYKTELLNDLKRAGTTVASTLDTETLGVAYKTVANQCTRIKEKLGLDRTSDLIRFALENRIETRAAPGFGERDA